MVELRVLVDRNGSRYHDRGGLISPRYLSWIAALPCVCGQRASGGSGKLRGEGSLKTHLGLFFLSKRGKKSCYPYQHTVCLGSTYYFFPIFIFYALFGMLSKGMGESFLLSKYEPLTPNIDGVMAL